MKKGFTLIELLAVIAILAVIFLIAIPKVIEVVENAKNSAYYSSEKMLEKATRIYLASNPDLIPGDGSKINIPISDLINAEVIKGIVDPKNGNACNAFVEVYKNSWSRIEYNAFIDCGTNYVTPGYNGLKAPFYYAYGDGAEDIFYAVAKDGTSIVSVGYSNSNVIPYYSHKGTNDAIIVKHNSDGTFAWANNFGGTYQDYYMDVLNVSDGYVAVGYTESTDKDMSSLNRGANDAIISKYDKDGNLLWFKVFGGNSSDFFMSAELLSDGYIVTGYSYSSTNELTGIRRGGYDVVIVKYDFNGNLLWNKNFGGTADDYAYKIVKTSSNELLISGQSSSTTHEFVGLNKGSNDAFIAKFDLSGNIILTKNFGGTGTDTFRTVIETPSYYIAGGESYSNNVDMAGLNKGNNDAVSVYYNKDLTFAFLRAYGGSGYDAIYGYDIRNTDIIATGRTSSSNGDLTGLNKGGYDALCIIYDELGNLNLNKTLGGTSTDYAYDIVYNTDVFVVGTTSSSTNDFAGKSPTGLDAFSLRVNSSNVVDRATLFTGANGIDYLYDAESTSKGFVVAGFSGSTSKQFANNYGSYDGYLFKYDFDGKLLWSKNYGGSSTDYFYSVANYNDSFVAGGITYSNNLNIAGLYKGNGDGLLMMVSEDGSIIWTKLFGGTNGYDQINDVKTVSDGILIAGYSSSSNGDMTGQYVAGNDAVIAKYDFSGNVIWVKGVGGNSTEVFSKLLPLDDGYVAVGYTSSSTGVFTGLNKGSNDALIVRFNSDLTIRWIDTFGGSAADYFKGVAYNNGYVYAVGYASSTDLDMASLSKGGEDSIIVKYNDLTGVEEAKIIYGGSSADNFMDANVKDGFLDVVGYSSSTNLDLVGLNKGGGDITFTKHSLTDLSVSSKVNYGSSSTDLPYAFGKVRDGYVITGYTYGYNGVFANQGSIYLDGMVVGIK